MEIATVTDTGAADAPTRERVARTILELGPSTAADLAERLHLTPAAVRRHLEHLVAGGAVEAREQRVRGSRGRGRPAKVFALTQAGRDRFEQHYDDLAVQALRFLAETGGQDAVARFAEARMGTLEQRIAAVRAAHPDLSATEAVARALRDAGFAAAVREGPVGEQLCQQHCPVAHVAHEFPQLCEAETALIARVLGRHVQRLATIAHGDGVCTTSIPGPVPVAPPGVRRAAAGPPTPTPPTRTVQTPTTHAPTSNERRSR